MDASNSRMTETITQLLNLTSTEECPLVAPFLPRPHLVPDRFATIEEALGIIGKARFPGEWNGIETSRAGRTLPNQHVENTRPLFDDPSVSDRLKKVIAQSLMEQTPALHGRWKRAVDELLQMLFDKKTHAIDPADAEANPLPTTFWAAPEEGRPLIENGEVTVDGRVLRAVIHRPSLEAALAPDCAAPDDAEATAGRNPTTQELDAAVDAWLEEMKTEWGNHPPSMNEAYNICPSPTKRDAFRERFKEIVGTRKRGEKKL